MDSLNSGWNELVRNVVTWLPKLAGFVLILAIGFILAKVLARAADALLERLGFDRAIERGGIGRMLAASDYDASHIVGKLVYWAVALVTLTMAFGVFGANPVSEVLTSIVAFIPKLLVGIVIFIIVAALANGARDIISATLSGLSYGRTLGTIAYASILFLGGVAALNQIGIAVTVTTSVLTAVLAALAGVIIVGVGGGLVKPMQARWENWLSTIASEAPKVKAQVAQAGSERAQARVPAGASGTAPSAGTASGAYPSAGASARVAAVSSSAEAATGELRAAGTMTSRPAAGAPAQAPGTQAPATQVPRAQGASAPATSNPEPTVQIDSLRGHVPGVSTGAAPSVASASTPSPASTPTPAARTAELSEGESFSANWLRTHGYGGAPTSETLGATNTWAAGDGVTTGSAATDSPSERDEDPKRA